MYSWLFSGAWAKVDDTREGAIERIRIALDAGVPAEFAATEHHHPERYAQEHPGAPGVPRAR